MWCARLRPGSRFGLLRGFPGVAVVLAAPLSAQAQIPKSNFLDSDNRLQAVGYRLAARNADLCSQPRMMSGLSIHDIAGFSAIARPSAERFWRLGYGFGVRNVAFSHRASLAMHQVQVSSNWTISANE